MAIFSRCDKVLEADGTEMSVRDALVLINRTLDEVLREQEGDFDSDTGFAIQWFSQYGFSEGRYGEADVLARAYGVGVDGLVRAGVLEARAGKVRLLRRAELEETWDPGTDERLTVWEVTHHLSRRLEHQGESGAADLFAKVEGMTDSARALAYRLFNICERKKWAEEARPYNALITSWQQIEKLSSESGSEPGVGQGALDM
jgi:putative DNA methylase